MSLQKLSIYNLIEKAKKIVNWTDLSHVITKMDNIKVFEKQTDYKFLITKTNGTIQVFDSKGNEVVSGLGTPKVQNILRNKQNRKPVVIDTERETKEETTDRMLG